MIRFLPQRSRFSGPVIGLALALLASPAAAHDFGRGSGYYESFLEGVAATFETMPAILLLVAAGLYFAIWSERGFPRVWPGLVAGAVAGLAVATLLEAGLALELSILALTVLFGLAGAAALLPGFGVTATLAILAGAASAIAVMAGHGSGPVPPAAYAGILASLAFLPSMVAACGSILREQFSGGWTLVSLRALSSWTVAVAIMVAAFSLRAA